MLRWIPTGTKIKDIGKVFIELDGVKLVKENHTPVFTTNIVYMDMFTIHLNINCTSDPPPREEMNNLYIQIRIIGELILEQAF